MRSESLAKFFKLESLGGILLFLAAILAVVLENSFLGGAYDAVRDLPISISLGTFVLSKPLLLWVNDGLMAIFFLLVGLELKREAIDGQLSTKEQIVLPLAAAFGGIAVPAAIYTLLNFNDPAAMRGWAIPAATDIAFALGVLTLFGKRVPTALKVFLTALAIFDDIAAIVIIAVFYTGTISMAALMVAGVVLSLLYVLNRSGVSSLAPFFVLGLILWIAVLQSGVHATLAGVALAFAIPARSSSGSESPLVRVEHGLHPWVVFGVLPLFAFLNAGVSLTGVSVDTVLNPTVLGIAIGLLVGKQIGAFGGAWLVVRLGLASLPASVSWLTLYGVCVLSGVGFTMSLFIGTLAFSSPADLTLVRLGVISGSLASTLIAAVVLYVALPRRDICKADLSESANVFDSSESLRIAS